MNTRKRPKLVRAGQYVADRYRIDGDPYPLKMLKNSMMFVRHFIKGISFWTKSQVYFFEALPIPD